MTSISQRSVERAERQGRIVQAARDCIAESGIHSATVAEIAARAMLGVGQVYRIFESKEAIVSRIANDDLAETRAMIQAAQDSLENIVEALCALAPQAVDRCFDPRRVALRIEFAAEAARNPAVAVILRAADREGRAAFEKALRSDRRLSGDLVDFQARCECVYMLFDGLAVRSLQHPQADRSELTRLVQMMLRRLFS